MREPLTTLLEFMKIPSVSGSESVFVDHLYRHLEKRFAHDVLELQKVADNRYNVVLQKGNPKLTLTSHTDTVPTTIPARQKGNVAYGTGACDAKGQIVTQLQALEQAIKLGLRDYACCYVVGEEVDSCGAAAAAQHPLLRGSAILNGEPTNNLFAHESRGVIELKLTAAGTEKHSSQLPLDSATHKMIAGLASILELDSKDLSINIGTLNGGVASNVSAGNAVAELCVRSSLPSDELIRRVEAVASQLDNVATNIIEPLKLYVPPGYRDTAISVPFCSDSAYFAPNYTNNMLFGPGSITVAHSAEEQISLEDINAGAATITKVLLAMNGNMGTA